MVYLPVEYFLRIVKEIINNCEKPILCCLKRRDPHTHATIGSPKMPFSQIQKFPWRLKQQVVRQTIVLIKYCHLPNVFANCKLAGLPKTNTFPQLFTILLLEPVQIKEQRWKEKSKLNECKSTKRVSRERK